MPEISRYFGIIIAMFYNDHAPAHFHVRYNEQKAIIEIETLQILEGKLSPRILGFVVEWASQHQVSYEKIGAWLAPRKPYAQSNLWSKLC